MSEFDDYTRKVMSISVALAALCAIAIFLTTYHDQPELFAGFCLGATFSMLRWRLIIWDLKRFARGASGTGPWLRGFFIRYGLTGAVIAISVASAQFSIVTTVIGIFLVNAVIIGEQIIVAVRARSKGQETWE